MEGRLLFINEKVDRSVTLSSVNQDRRKQELQTFNLIQHRLISVMTLSIKGYMLFMLNSKCCEIDMKIILISTFYNLQ